MRKFLSTLSLVAALALATAACSSSPTTTDTGASRAQCDEWDSEYNDALVEYLSLIPLASTPSNISALVSTGRQAVTSGRTIVSECRHHAPAEYAEMSRSLDSLESTLDGF